MAAKCLKCGTTVGCSCALKEGLCPTCYSAKQTALKTAPKPVKK